MATGGIPFKLRATDVVKHIINVDSRFRDQPWDSDAANFYFSLLSPVRNVLRIRVTSVEFPNNYKFFAESRRNTTLRLLWLDSGTGQTMSVDVKIEDGNYNAGGMLTELTDAIAASPFPYSITIGFSEATGRFTFDTSGATMKFGIEPAGGGWPDRQFDYGLAYYLGFTRQTIHRAVAKPSGGWRLESDQCANFAADNYLFLRVNDFACVRQTVQLYSRIDGMWKADKTDFTALAKLVLREPKNYMTFDDYASQHAKEVVFPAPVDLSRLRVQVLDIYGEVIDMCSTQFSFSLEVLEVRNPAVYNAVRDQLVAGALESAVPGRGAAGGVAGP
jgi:hypothetical protein